MCVLVSFLFLKTNGLCSPGHKTLGLGMGMEWPETGNSCVAAPALQIAPKCFLKVDVVRKKQSLPTFPQSSDFPPSLDFMGQIALSFFDPGFVLAGTVFIFQS